MSLLIDGYNLLHVAGILAHSAEPDTFEKARLALLNFLAESLDPKEIPRTTVVFDASRAPPGLPRRVNYRGFSVRFASRWPDADSLIEELIRQDNAPRRLLVVSSDHRLQRAARRRRAKSIDADAWYARVVRRHRRRLAREQSQSARPPVPLLEEDVNYWLRQFGGETAFEQLLREECQKEQTTTENITSSEKTCDQHDERRRAAGLDATGDPWNPFPPGYAEDLEE